MLSWVVGKQIFKQNLKYSISLILVIAATMLSFAVMIASVNNINHVLKVISPISSNKGIYCSIGMDETLLDGLTNVKSVETVTETLIYSNGTDTYTVASVSDALSKVQFPLLRGKWFDNVTADNVIEAVITEDSGYEVGDKILTTVADENRLLLIVGILPNNTGYLSFSGYGTSGFEDVIKTRSVNVDSAYDYNRFPLIICGDCLFEAGESASSFRMILFNDDISTEAYDANITYIQNGVGLSKTIEQMLVESKEIKSQQLSIYLPVIIILAILSIIVLIAVIDISYENSSKVIAVAYFSGGTYKTVFCAYMLFLLTIMACAAAVYGIAFVILVKSLFAEVGSYGNISLIGALVPIVSVAVMIACTAAVAATPLKKPIVKYMKKEG